MKIILTRHGQTEENKAGILQGHLPGKLSEEGIAQAKKVAQRLKNEHVDYIFSSDLARAADTAKEIAKLKPGTPIEFVEELRERHLGEFQGKRKPDIGWEKENFKEIFAGPKGGENMDQLFTRAERFLQKILKKHPQSSVLFVGHNGINKALIAAITKKNASSIMDMESLKNTSVCIFEIDGNKNHKTLLFNCTKHLE